MIRRSPSFPKSIFKSRAFLRRPSKRAVALALALLWLNQHTRAANSPDNVIGTGANTALDTSGNYSAGTPGTTSDVVFTSGTAYSGTFTLNTTALSIGTLDDLNATALMITGSKSITLNTAANSVSGTAADLLYVASNGSLTINDTGGLVFATSGNVDAAGTVNLGTSPITINAGNTLTFIGAGATTVGGVIANTTGAVVVNDAGGSVTFSGANAYTGGTTLTAGTLNINNATALGTGTFVIGGGTIDNSTAGAITDSKNNALTLNGDFAFTGTSALNLGTGATTLGAAAGTSRTITINGSTLTLGGIIGNGTTANNLIKAGAGTLVLGGVNTYSGGTTINAGILQYTNIGTANGTNSGAFTLGGGTLQLNTTVNNFSYNPAITLTADSTLSNIGVQNNLLGGTINGGGHALSISTGANPLFINTAAASITNVSQFNVTAGALGFDTSLGKGNGFPVVVSNGASLLLFNGAGATATSASNNITLNGGTGLGAVGALDLQSGGAGNTTLTGTVTLNSTSSIGVAANSLLISGSVTGSGGLTKIGAGTLTLESALDSYSGGSILTAGYLEANNLATNTANTLLEFGTGLITLNGGRLDLKANGSGSTQTIITGDGMTGNNVTVGASAGIDVNQALVSGANTGNTFVLNNLSIGNFTLSVTGAASDALRFSGTTTLTGNATFNPTSANLTLGGAVGGAFSLTKTGTGTLTLSGANTYSGGTNINGGTLSLNSAETAGTSGPLGASGTISFGGGTLQYTSNNQFDYSSRFSTAASQAYSIDTNSQNVTFATALTSSGGTLTKIGAGTLTLTGTNTYSGATTINGGTLAFAGGSALPSGSAISLGNGTLQINNDGTGSNQTISLGNSVTANGAITGTIGVGNNGGGSTGNTVAFGALSTGASGSSVNFNFTGANGYLESFSSLALVGGGGNTTTLNPTTTSVTITGNVTNPITTNPPTNKYDTLVLGGSSTGNAINGVISDNANYVSVGNGDTRITMSGTGNWTLAGANTYHGPTAVSAGTLNLTGSLGNGTASGNGMIGSTAITTSGTGVFTESSTGSIKAASSFTQGSTGTSILAGANSYSGTTTVSAGVLDVTGAGTLGGGSNALALSGGTLDLGTTSQSVGAVTITGAATIQNGSLTGTSYAASNTTGTAVVSANLLGTGALTKTGAGTLTLSGTNSYSGVTFINGGTLNVGSTGALGSTSALTFGGGTLQYSAANTTDYSPLIINSTGAISIDTNGQNVTYASALASSNTGGLTKAGAGSLTLSVANSYSGTTTVSAGVLDVTGAGTLGGGSNALALSGGTLDLGTTSQSVGAVTITGAATIQNGSLTGTSYAASNTTGTAVVSANLLGTGALTKTGAGTLTLSGTNTYSGGTTLSAGQLNINNATALGTGAFTIGGGSIDNTSGADLTLTNNNTQNWNGSFTYVGSANNLNLGTGAVTLGANDTVTVTANTLTEGGAIGGAFSLTKAGAGTLLLTGANSYSGTSTVSGGVLEFANEASLYNGNTASWTAANLIGASGGTLAFGIGGTGGFTSSDVSLLLTNLDGAVNNNGLKSGSAIGLDTTNATGGTFTLPSVLNNTTGTGGGAVGLVKLGTGTLVVPGGNTYTNNTSINGGTLNLTGTIISSVYANSGNLVESSTGSIGGGAILTLQAAGVTSTLGGDNTFTGATTVLAGTLDVANALALQNSTLTLSGAGGVTFDSAVTGNAFTVGGLGGNPGIVLQNNAATPAPITLTVGNPINNASTLTSGVISGGGNLVLAGFSNTITLTGANTYTGTTTVTGSTLNLGGATANGSIGSGSNALALGGYANGGLLNYTTVSGTTAETQSFASTSFGAGENGVSTSTAYQTVNLGAISATGGATADINPNTTSAITTTNGNVNGILGGFATYGGKTTWAVAPATAGGAITGLANGAYTETGTALNVPANYAAQNIDVNASATPTGAINPNSLRFNTNTGYTLTLTGVNTIQSGGILQTATASNGGTITGGTLTGTAGGQLAITNGSGSATLNINSLIVDNGTPTAVAASGLASGGYIGFGNANNSFSGGLYFNGGRLNFVSGGTAFGTGNVTFGNQIYTNAGGGGINFGSNSVTSGLLVDAQGTNAANGDISSGGGTGNWTLIGTGTASFAGIIGNYASGRLVNLTLDSGTEIIANTQLGSNALTVNGGTFQVGNGYVGAYSNSANNVALNVGGGTFVEYGNLAGTTSQAFNSGLVVNAGASTVTALNNSGAGTLVSFAGAGSRAAGGTVNFVLPGGVQSATNGFTTVNLNTNGILGGYATVGGTDWATNATNVSGGNIIGLSNSAINSYAISSAITTAPGATANVDFQASNMTAYATQSINSLRFNTAAANTLTSTGTLTISSGGILETANVGANATAINGGTLVGSATDLVVIQNDTTGSLTISSVIAGGTAGLTKSGAGTLTLNPASADSFTGGIYLNGGVLNTTSNGIGTAGSFTFNGGTLQAAGTISSSKAVTIGATGGTIDTNGNGVTLSGVVGGTPSAGAGALGGFNSTGAFAFTKTGTGTLTLSNIANTFGGGLVINNGTVQDSSASGTGTFGTGYVTFGTSNTPTMSLGSHNVTVAGFIGSGSNGLITGGVTGTPVITLNGVSTQTFGGVIQNGSATSVGLTVNLNNPTESQILTGANTFSGVTTVTSGTLAASGTGSNKALGGTTSITVNGGGTLLLGTSNQVNAAAGIALGTTNISTGTLSVAAGASQGSAVTVTGGVASSGTSTRGLGALTLNNTSTLQFGGNSTTLVFGTLTTNGNVLNISGYSNTSATAGGLNSGNSGTTTTDDRLVFSNGGNTANDAALSSFNFGAGPGVGVFEINLDNGFYEVSVPEPSTWLGGAFLVGTVVWQYRRRSRQAVN